MTTACQGINPEYCKYYAQQNGGALPFYSGVRYQRGHGLGDILKGGIRSIGSMLLPTVARVGTGVVKDMLFGKKTLGSALKGRAIGEGKRLLGSVLTKNILGSALTDLQGKTPIKRKAAGGGARKATAAAKVRRVVSAKGRQTSSRGVHQRKKRSKDIFD